MLIIRNALIIIVPSIILTFLIGKGLSLFIKNEKILKFIKLIILLFLLCFFMVLVMQYVYNIND